MKFLCPGCGEYSVLRDNGPLDTGQYLTCSECDEDVVVDFSTPSQRASVHKEWLSVFGKISDDADKVGDIVFGRINELEERLKSVSDWLKYQANSEGGLVQNIEYTLYKSTKSYMRP